MWRNDDDAAVEAFLPGAKAIVAYEDGVPPPEVILNRLYLAGHIVTCEFVLLRQATQKPRGLLAHLRAWWAA